MHPVGDHTLYELQILPGQRVDASILGFYNKTNSYGGRDVLRSMIREPKKSLAETLHVQDLLKSILQNLKEWEIYISHAYIAASESYYDSNIAHTMSQDVFQHWYQTMMFSYQNPAEYQRIESGVLATIKVLKAMLNTIDKVKRLQFPASFQEDFDFLTSFLDTFILKTHLKNDSSLLSKRAVFYLDYFFRKQHKEDFRRILDIYYYLDAHIAIVKTAKQHGLSFPEFVETDACFEVTDIWHPLITNSVKNNFSITGDPGICILTGANTSGKTTFLKSSGIAIYVAHLGWPVAAGSLRLSFYDRLFTSIHLSDDIVLGYSHFYNEIMRVKEIAQALYDEEKCCILIDELFRGTNQEDALHCSKTVLNGFANYPSSVFIVSTHLMELLDTYLESPAVCFKCFKTTVTGRDFVNTFKLEDGIASEKVGKLIMEKVGIPSLLLGVVK
jgi:DNA mismatch repair protein MutS